MNKEPIVIVENNLSLAWARAFTHLERSPYGEVSCLITVINNICNEPLEDPVIRHELDTALTERGLFRCATVAETIFPISLWNPNKSPEYLYSRFLRLLPHLRKADRRNLNGTYFQRLISYGTREHNQLDYIIRNWRQGNHRRSAMQVTVFEPYVDQTHQKQRGFPCLQHVVFSPDGNGGLSITGFYATQHYFDRAYGNFLGLCYLGRFIAHEIGFTFTKMTCIANTAMLGKCSKREIQDTSRRISERLEETSRL